MPHRAPQTPEEHASLAYLRSVLDRFFEDAARDIAEHEARKAREAA
jgi:hypothetical protein